MTMHKSRAVLGFFSGSVVLALLTFASFRLRLNLAKVVRRDLIVVLLCPRLVNFLESAVIFLIGGGCLTFLFAPPMFSLRATDSFEVAGLISAAESHDCRFWSADNPPRGASFQLTLPAKAEASE
jgi:hypothetical protein